jgi:uncharacterized repeat protein (TIGR01451 family)
MKSHQSSDVCFSLLLCALAFVTVARRRSLAHSHRVGRRLLKRSLVLFTAVGLVAGTIAVELVLSSEAAVAALPTSATLSPFPIGSYIVDMGVPTQTIANGVKPYGLVYALIQAKVPVSWVIKDGKAKDDIDMTVAGKNYSGGPFVIDAGFASIAAPIIATWKAQGVVVDGPTAAGFTAPVYSVASYFPHAVLDATNAAIATPIYANAGIPATAYVTKTPAQLNGCDDLYVMPHADPAAATHANLINFNNTGGYIWAGCHAVSVLENIDTTGDGITDMNFLSANGLVPYTSHAAGSPPYTSTYPGSDPVGQYLGRTDSAHLNGSEQIYMPKAGGWRPTTNILEYDATQANVPTLSPGPAATMVYGRGFGKPANGIVLYESGHSIAKATLAENVAAERAFMNFHLLSGVERTPTITSSIPSSVVPGTTVPVTASTTDSSSTFTYQWSSSCGGTFANATAASTTFTAPTAAPATGCVLTVKMIDQCGRVFFLSQPVAMPPTTNLSISKTAALNPASAGANQTYTITVINSGPSLATNVPVTDVLPVGLTPVSATVAGGTCSFSGYTMNCTLASLPSTASQAITLVVSVDATAPPSLTNTATVNYSADSTPLNNSASVTTPVIHPGIKVVKSTTTPSVLVGGTAAYQYLVTNTGDTPLATVTVADDKCSPVTRTGGDANSNNKLDLTETWTYTCAIALMIDTTNVATARGLDSNGTAATSTDSEFVDVITPSLAILKSPDTQIAASGSSAPFAISVTNTGDVNLANVVVSDPLAPGCAQTIALLAVGASATIACTMPVSGSNGTIITNSATATAASPVAGGSPVSATDTAIVTVGTPQLTVTKTASPSPVKPGDTITYTILTTNTGATTQTVNSVNDPLPAHLTFVSSQIAAPTTVMAAKDEFGCFASPNNPGSYSCAAGISPSGWLANWVETADDNKPTSGDIKVATNAPGSLSLDVKNKAVSASRAVNLGTTGPVTLTFDYQVKKMGSGHTQTVDLSTDGGVAWTTVRTFANADDATSGLVTYSLASPTANSVLRIVTGASNNSGDEVFYDNITFNAPGPVVTTPGGTAPTLLPTPKTLLPGQALTTTVTAAVNADIDPGVAALLNVATITTAGGQSLPAMVSTPVVNPKITVTKSASQSTVRAGGSVTYTYVVSNADTDAVSSVNPTDDTCSPLVFINGDTNGNSKLDQDESWTYTCTTTLSIDTTNTVTVQGVDALGNQLAQPPTATAFVSTYHPSLTVVPTVDQTIVRPGARVTVLYTVTNTGDVPLSGALLTDPSCSPLVGPTEVTGNGDAVFNPGEIWTYSCTSILAVDTTFSPTITAKDPYLLPVSATGSASTNVISPKVAITKTPSATNVAPGTSITYTFVATNIGDDPVSTVTVTDDACSPTTYFSGDTNVNGKLDITEAWTFLCTTPISVDTTDTATFHGVDSLGAPVPASATAFVNVLAASLVLSVTPDASITYVGATTALTYRINNNGEIGIATATPTDPACSPIVYSAGDINSNGIIDPAEIWSYTCNLTITGSISSTFTAPATTVAAAPLNPAPASAYVTAINPSLSIQKQANATNVPSGTAVTFTYRVTNTSSVVSIQASIDTITVTDDKCASPSYVSGDTDLDSALSFDLSTGVSEVWIFTCTSTLLATTTNTARAQGLDELSGAVTSPTASVTVVVPRPPVAVTENATTPEDTAVLIDVLANDSDPDLNLDPTSVSIFGAPTLGTVTLDPLTGVVTYTPAQNYTGTDTFTYRVCDTSTPALCTTAVVNITITPTNDGPVALLDSAITPEDTAVVLDPLSNDADLEGPLNPASVVVTAAPAHGTTNVDPLTGKITYTPFLNFHGTDSYEYQVCDTGTPLPALCATAIDTVTVLPVNDPPVANDDTIVGLKNASTSIPILNNDGDPDNNLNLTLVTTTIPSQGSAAFDPLTGRIVYSPTLNYFGIDTFTYTVCDLGFPVYCDVATVTVDVQGFNVPPVALDDNAATPEDTAVTLNTLDNDSDSDSALDPASVLVTSIPSHGTTTVDSATGKITYTPFPNFNGADSYTYQVCDTGAPLPAQCALAIEYITINPVNDPPLATNDSASTLEGTPVTLDPLSNDSDIDGGLNPASVVVTGAPLQGTTSIDPLTGKITYTPDPHFSGTDTYTYLVCDTGSPLPVKCTTAIDTITVTPTNNPPVAQPDAATTPIETAVTLDPLANDSDLEGPLDPASVAVTVAPLHGTTTVDPLTGKITYLPAPHFYGTDSYTYQVCDTGTPLPAKCATAADTITVVNHPPVAQPDSAITGAGVAVTLDLLGNDVDPDGNIVPSSLTITHQTAHGTVTVDPPTGKAVYTPSIGFVGVDTFTYQVCDSGSPTFCTEAVASITVAAGVGSVTGSLWLDLRASGERTAGDPTLGGIRVLLTLPDGTVVATTTAADGSYRFDGLPTGPFSVAVDPSTLPTGLVAEIDPDATADLQYSFTLAPAEQRTAVDFGVQGTSSLHGVLYADTNKDGILGEGDNGIPDATLRMVWAGLDGVFGTPDDQVLSLRTSPDGSYALDHLPAGSYQVEVLGTLANRAVSGQTVQSVQLTAGQPSPSINFPYGARVLPKTGSDLRPLLSLAAALLLLGVVLRRIPRRRRIER